jgi:uncharacterized protein involved in exopolysaccharide biosynthesis
MEEKIEKIPQQPPHFLTVLIRARRFIILGTLVCILATAAASFFLPDIYEANAVLLVSPPKFSTGLRPNIMSVLTYQQMLLNKDLISQLLNELRKKHEAEFRNVNTEILFDSLDVEVKKEGRSTDGDIYSPLLLLRAENMNREIARETVTIWVELFMKIARELTSAQTTETEKFIVDQSDTAKRNLDATEKALRDFNENNNIALMSQNMDIKRTTAKDLTNLLETTNVQISETKENLRHIDEQLAVLGVNGKSIILSGAEPPRLPENSTEFQKKLHSEIVNKKVLFEDAKKKRLEFLAAFNIEYEKKLLESYQIERLAKEEEYDNLDFRMKVLDIKIAEVDKELKNHNETKLLKVGLSSELIIEMLQRKPTDEELQEMMKKYSTTTEVLDNVFASLMDLRVTSLIEKNTLQNKKAGMEKEIARTRKLTDDARRRIEELEQKWTIISMEYTDAFGEFQRLEKLYSDIGTSRGKLTIDIASKEAKAVQLKMDIITVESEIEIQNAKLLQATLERKNLEREVDLMEAAYKMFSTKREEARAARTEERTEIRVAAEAITPDYRVKPRRGEILVIAAFIGLVLSCIIALLMNFLERNKDQIAPPPAAPREKQTGEGA